MPWATWVNASYFTEYWSLTRGYIGKVCTSRSAVNAYAEPGDFLSWYNLDTLNWTHLQFVQSKNMKAEIYCSQHTSNYYDQKFNDRVEASRFNDWHVYIIDMTP